MPDYEIRYLNDEGEPALIHKTHHEDDDAVDRAAYRMLVGSGFADYEIWREEYARSGQHGSKVKRRKLKNVSRIH
jgi:hypothetical protein